MTEIYFNALDRVVTVQVKVDEQSSRQEVEASPRIVSDILQAIQVMLAQYSGTPADVTKSEKRGELSGSSADRAVSIVAETLNIGRLRI